MVEPTEPQPAPDEIGVVALGDAADVTRGGGGNGSDDKRYAYQ